MRRKLYRLAVLLAFLSLLPLVLFLSRREEPPLKVKVKVHQRQTIENFTLESTGKRVWTLSAPEAQMVDKDKIYLKEPVLTVYLKEPVKIYADSAVYFRDKGIVDLISPRLVTANYTAYTGRGVYNLKTATFKSLTTCTATAPGKGSTVGASCTVKVDKGVVIIKGKVKSVLYGALK
ncbi:protein of unknown function DUF1239 [Thermovibrio ammonificans HB-1]|uniref:LPS export ABC transporter periplasmic protein LptC n=1 Tax=Thermovibrio ammonificans (strain DSM 15698 / JCM 12110 / HB-1) TaxID=648996 RepID=E8T2M2_THEA1|nr:LPS export ABC transporter periplasmic protein LptC [Thermovibrio ammonificans]ADU97117.1 protein of unknown function DUF1239 [Thermovibrio ammonificans HB-1]